MRYVSIIRYIHTNNISISSTKNLKRRVNDHTQKKAGFELKNYEAWKSENEVRRREHDLKNFGKAYGQLKGRIRESLIPEWAHA
jgi:hypothetical protein